MIPHALSNGEVVLLIALAAIPVAALSFVLGAREALRQIGRGPMSIDPPDADGKQPESRPAAQVREDELRQLLEAKAYRQRSRGEEPLDVDAELARLNTPAFPAPAGADPALEAEIRAHVVARNERRARQGREPLDVEAEVAAELARLV